MERTRQRQLERHRQLDPEPSARLRRYGHHPRRRCCHVIDTAVSISGLTVGGGSSLTVAADGVLNILGNLTLNGVLTNAGTVNWQDGQISVSQNNLKYSLWYR